MTDDDWPTATGLSRRDLLRRGATAAGVAGAGVAGLSGTAAASDVCPRSPAYWADDWHPHLPDPFDVAGVRMAREELQSFLGADPGTDRINLMARQYAATAINLWLRLAGDQACAHGTVEVDRFGATTPVELKNRAQHWLRASEWDGTRHEGKQTWYANYGAVDGRGLWAALATFNTGGFDALDCGCAGVDRVEDDHRPALGPEGRLAAGAVERPPGTDELRVRRR